MAFDAKRFQKEKFRHRTEDVPVPDLKEWFGPDDNPVWVVRGLEGAELGFVRDSAARNRNIAAILEGLISASDRDKVQGIRDLLGMGNSIPDDIAQRIEMAIMGSVDPSCDRDLAVKLCKSFPIEFYSITNTISRLTGQGQVPGKKKDFGKTEVSAPASAYAT